MSKEHFEAGRNSPNVGRAEPRNEKYPDYELAFCEKCFQMTNHLNGKCQKCKKREENDMTEELKKLKQDMLDAQEEYKAYFDKVKRPMTEEERKDFDEHDRTFQSPLEKVEQEEPYMIEFKTLQDFKEMQKISDRMIETNRAFILAYNKWKEDDNT